VASAIYKRELLTLQARIENPDDIVLFEEARRCFEAGALRSAYLMTWIAAAESMKSKLALMAQRDHGLAKVMGEIARLEAAERPTDRVVAEAAREFGLITSEEHLQLQYLYTMRGVYAHPLGASPSELDVVAALYVIVDSVLSREPQLRKGYAAQVVRSLFSDVHLLDDIRAVVDDYGRSVTRRLSTDTVPYLFGALVRDMEGVSQDPDLQLMARRGEWFAVGALTESGIDLQSAKWELEQSVASFPVSCSRILSAPTIWPRLAGQIQDSVLGHLLAPVVSGKTTTPSSDALARAFGLSHGGLLNGRQDERLAAAIINADYTSLMLAHAPLSATLPKVIADLKSHDWYAQNPAMAMVSHVGPTAVGGLAAAQQSELGRNVLQAAEGGANGAIGLLAVLDIAEDPWPSEFVTGLALEVFVNEALQFRWKGRRLWSVSRAIAAHPDVDAILAALSQAIEGSTPKGWPDDYHTAAAEVAAAVVKLDVPIGEILIALQRKCLEYPATEL
jgi:hypothetical protein